MPILGLYTKNEVESMIKKERRLMSIEYTQNNVKKTDEMRSGFRERESFLKGKIATKQNQLDYANEWLEKLVRDNNSFYNKEVWRLEMIKNRTKSKKVRNKCENRILKYKEKMMKLEDM